MPRVVSNKKTRGFFNVERKHKRSFYFLVRIFPKYLCNILSSIHTPLKEKKLVYIFFNDYFIFLFFSPDFNLSTSVVVNVPSRMSENKHTRVSIVRISQQPRYNSAALFLLLSQLFRKRRKCLKPDKVKVVERLLPRS